MNLSIKAMTQALQGPTMEAVIALSERTQTLACHPNGVIFTFYRSIDRTILIGYSDKIERVIEEFTPCDFVQVASRRGTRREERLVQLTLKENSIGCSYGPGYYSADGATLLLLEQLDWPIGQLAQTAQGVGGME